MLVWKIPWTEESDGVEKSQTWLNMHTLLLCSWWWWLNELIGELRFFLKFNFCWCVVALQCVIFCSTATAKWISYACMLSHFRCVRLCATLWTIACQLSMEWSRQECWSGLNFLLQGIVPTQGLNLPPLTSVLADGFFTTNATTEAIHVHISPLLGISFPFRSPESTEWVSCAMQ